MRNKPGRLFPLARRLALYVYYNRPFDRFLKYRRKHGIFATIRQSMKTLLRGAAQQEPETAQIPEPEPYDLLHGTDTGGWIVPEKLSTVSLSAVYSTEYLGIMPSALRQALSDLPVKHDEYTFVDLGCGKGRALLVAAEYPFRHLLGVELAGELCEIAKANAVKIPICNHRISILNQDAAKVTFPDGPLVVYLYHPFLSPVLKRVLANLERQWRESQRHVLLLYGLNPHYSDVMDSFPFLKEISDRTYAFSTEEARFDKFHRAEEQFSLYSTDLSLGA